MIANIVNKVTGTTTKIFVREEIPYAILEIAPSKLTSNSNVRWLISEFKTLSRSFSERVRLQGGTIYYTPEMTIWWEVFMYKGQIKFYLTVPDKDDIKLSLSRHIMKTWKQANVKVVSDYMVTFNPTISSMSKLTLKHHSILSLDTQNPLYSSLESLLNAKHYLKGEDVAMLQIGMRPKTDSWNQNAARVMDNIKESGVVPRKKGKKFTIKDALIGAVQMVGLVSEELMNLLGDFFIPGWEHNKELAETLKDRNGEVDSLSTRAKLKNDAFGVDIRLVAQCDDEERRRSIIRAMVGGFDPLEGDNKLLENVIEGKALKKNLDTVTNRKMTVRMNGDVLCSLELAKIVNVPDQKSQAEHYNEISVVNHRGEADIPKEIFMDDGIPFATYEDTDGIHKTIYFSARNKNHLCMARVIIGEPGTGKTTFAVNNALDSFNAGYGAFVIDAADGKLAQRLLDRVRPDQRDKVRIIDFMNTDYPIGLGWNEIFRGRGSDIVEDIIVEEVISYIEMVAETELNMRAKQWVENAVKVVYVTPDATLQDVENMLNNAKFRESKIPTIEDPELRSDWEYFHNKFKPEERKNIYDEAFRRLSAVIRKKALKNFILQRPKKNEDGTYAIDFRKWMDEGYLVIVKANETLGETLQTALVSFVLSKFNLAIVSREDITDEDDRPPCFLYLDEPDHYIKGSERWRNMLTRYRKYRCGLNFMFHGWQQLKQVDKDLPKIIRKAGPHYIIFQTDEDNLLDLKPVIEPEFKVADVAKGMPQFHAIIRLKMYGKEGAVVPAFMAKAIDAPEKRYKKYNNSDLFEVYSKLLGRPKQEVMDELFRNKNGSEFNMQDILATTSTDGDGDLKSTDVLEVDEDDKRAEDARVRRILQHEVSKFLQQQMDNGEDPDEDLLLEMDNLLEEG